MEMMLESDVIEALTAFSNAGAKSGWIAQSTVIAALNMIRERDMRIKKLEQALAQAATDALGERYHKMQDLAEHNLSERGIKNRSDF